MKRCTQDRNPLVCIASAKTIRERLDKILLEAARLKILLRTAEEIEAAKPIDETGGQP